MGNSNRLFYILKVESYFRSKRFRGKVLILKILKYLKPRPKKTILKTIHGFRLLVDPLYDKGIELSIYNSGTYEKGTLWCFSHLIKPGYLIIDAGANIGLTSIYASYLTGPTGEVFSFEPLKTTFDILNTNISLNRISNISTFNIALSNYIGKGYIYPNIHINRGAASLNPNSVEQENFEVKVRTVDNWLFENKIINIDFVKIDVEGLEYEVLQGAREIFNQKIKPILCIEYSEEVEKKTDLMQLYFFLLKDLRYQIFKSIKGKGQISKLIRILNKNDLPFHDNIYCLQEEHLRNLSPELFHLTEK